MGGGVKSLRFPSGVGGSYNVVGNPTHSQTGLFIRESLKIKGFDIYQYFFGLVDNLYGLP